MYFQRLDGFAGERGGVLTLGYRFKDDEGELWTSRFNRAKFGGGQAQARTLVAACKVLSTALGTVTLEGPVLVTGAIGSQDTQLRAGSPVHLLGEHIAADRGCQWHPALLSKRPHRSLKRLSNRSEREAEVRGAYSAGIVGDVRTVLVIDDFFTNGSTLNDAVRAIVEANPKVATIYGVGLGKTESKQYWRERRSVELDNSHVGPHLDELWATTESE